MATISLCMIVKDEEKNLSRCLDSVHDLVDEIIIIDTGSKDRTIEVAKQYTQKIYKVKWNYNFSAARNFSFTKASMDYILWLDADDVLLEKDRIKFIELKRYLTPDKEMILMKYNVAFDEVGNVTMSYYRERLLKRTKNFKWLEPVHEYIPIEGNVFTSEVCITHTKTNNSNKIKLLIYNRMMEDDATFTPRSLYYYAKELYFVKKYDSAIYYYNLFLRKDLGSIEDKISACLELSKCYKLKKDVKNQLKSLLKSLEYDIPRAEICCELGYYYEDIKKYENAVFWFENAMKSKENNSVLELIEEDCYGYIPAIELCVCYFNLGNINKATEYNNYAGTLKPNDATVNKNRIFFQNKAST